MMYILFICSIYCFNIEAYNFFMNHEEGWHWYKNIEEDEDKLCGQSNSAESAIHQIQQYKRKLEEARATAIINPTHVNVERYQRIQYEALSRATKFASVWMQNIYKNPNIDFTVKYPVSSEARKVYLQNEIMRKERKIKQLSKSYGLFFFFKVDCHYCDAFSPVLKAFSEKYNWEVLAISEFGDRNKYFDRNVKDNGLAEIWGVASYPSLFAVNPKNGHVIPIANGMISIEEMEERILSISGENDESN